MRSIHYKLGLLVTTVLSLGLVAPAMAQEEEIIVTARRMEERLQDVPISMTVFNQNQLNKQNVTNVSDLVKLTPSLGLSASNKFGGSSADFSIRGFAKDDRTAPSVGIYFGEVVTPRNPGVVSPAGDAYPGLLFDLQNVQVLKGPQGTLFGRNTTGGSVLLVPTKPKREFGGYIEGSYGNFDMKRLQGVLNVPLGPKARLRVGFDRMTRDGYVNMHGTDLAGTLIGSSHQGNVDYIAGRASLVVDITPDLENYTIAQMSNSDINPISPMLFTGNPDLNPLNPLIALQPALAAQAARARANGDFYYSEQDIPGGSHELFQVWQIQNITTWHASDLITVKNIASYGVLRQYLASDFAGTNLHAPTFFGDATIHIFGITPSSNAGLTDQYSITEELQLQGRSANNRLTWQTGIYYEQSNPRQFTGTSSAAFGATCLGGNLTVCFPGATAVAQQSGGYIRFRTLAAYGQATYAILENLKVTAGLRFTHDENTSGAFNLNHPYNAAPPFGINYGVTNCGFFTLTAPTCIAHVRDSSDAPTWTLNLKYDVTPNANVYINYSRGYRQGQGTAFIPHTATNLGFIDSWKPETVEVYEAGAKTSWQGKVPGVFNTAIFYNDFSNQQLAVGLTCVACSAGQSQGVINAGASHMWGIEIEGQIRPFESLRVEFNGGYLATKIDRLQQPGAIPPYDQVSFFSQQGSPLPYASKWKATVTPTYTLPMPDTWGTMEFGVTYIFDSGYTVTIPPQSIYNKSDRLNLFNLNFNWNSIAGSPVDLALFCTNLLDDTYATNYEGTYKQLGWEARLPGQPRFFGGRLKLRFGADAKS